MFLILHVSFSLLLNAEEEELRDVVLVTDGDSETGQMSFTINYIIYHNCIIHIGVNFVDFVNLSIVISSLCNV